MNLKKNQYIPRSKVVPPSDAPLDTQSPFTREQARVSHDIETTLPDVREELLGQEPSRQEPTRREPSRAPKKKRKQFSQPHRD